jgi:hypothetical protein
MLLVTSDIIIHNYILYAASNTCEIRLVLFTVATVDVEKPVRLPLTLTVVLYRLPAARAR